MPRGMASLVLRKADDVTQHVMMGSYWEDCRAVVRVVITCHKWPLNGR